MRVQEWEYPVWYCTSRTGKRRWRRRERTWGWNSDVSWMGVGSISVLHGYRFISMYIHPHSVSIKEDRRSLWNLLVRTKQWSFTILSSSPTSSSPFLRPAKVITIYHCAGMLYFTTSSDIKREFKNTTKSLKHSLENCFNFMDQSPESSLVKTIFSEKVQQNWQYYKFPFWVFLYFKRKYSENIIET